MSDIFPESDAERAKYPVGDFVTRFFPRAIALLAKHSWENQQKHSPHTKRLTWNKDASIGDGNQLMRHFIEGELEAVAWRALELIERREMESETRWGAITPDHVEDVYQAALAEERRITEGRKLDPDWEWAGAVNPPSQQP